MINTTFANMFLKACKACGIKKIRYSTSNKKLIPNKFIAYFIFNLPAIKTCPNATPHCKGKCYARKAEIAYPDCLPAREDNYQTSLQDDFYQRLLYSILSYRKGTRKKLLVVRIHESGDFYSQEYADTWLKVAEACKGEKIIFIAYTKSFAFFDGKKLPENFRLRASVWDDTSKEDLEIIERNGWPIYTAVEKFQKGDTFYRCRCEDCSTCAACWSKRKDIRCEIH